MAPLRWQKPVSKKDSRSCGNEFPGAELAASYNIWMKIGKTQGKKYSKSEPKKCVLTFSLFYYI